MVQNFCKSCTILNYIVVYLSEMTSFIASRCSCINESTTSLWIPRLLRTLHVFSTRNSNMVLFIDLAIDSFSKPCQTTSKPKISPPLYKCISWPVCPIHKMNSQNEPKFYIIQGVYSVYNSKWFNMVLCQMSPFLIKFK